MNASDVIDSGAWGIGKMFMMLLFWLLVIGGLVLGARWVMKEGAIRVLVRIEKN